MVRSLAWFRWCLVVCIVFFQAEPTAGTDKKFSQVPSDPSEMTYRSEWVDTGMVTLSNGQYSAPAAPGSSSELKIRLTDWKAIGTADGHPAEAVILVTDAGGSGLFYDLALLSQEGGAWLNSDMVFLGDRVGIYGLALRDNHLFVTLTTQGPQDSMCCPTQQVEKIFAIQDGKLVAVSERFVPRPPELVGVVWHWVRSIYNDDSKVIPSDPSVYTVNFGEDGRVSIRADCNLKGGVYFADVKSLNIKINPSTRAMCPDDSLERTFERDLSGSTLWFVKDGDLYVDLKFDAGTMCFTR